MTDKQFIQFSKEYFGDLDYTKLSEAEYKRIYESKEAERILSMANDGKLEGIFGKLLLKSDGMTVSLMYEDKVLSSSTTLTIPIPLKEKVIIQVSNNDSNNTVSTKPDDTPSPILQNSGSSGTTPPSPDPTPEPTPTPTPDPPTPPTVYSIENVSPLGISGNVGDSINISASFYERLGDYPKQPCTCNAALYIRSTLAGYTRITEFISVSSINYTLTLPDDTNITDYIIVINTNREARLSDHLAEYSIPTSIQPIPTPGPSPEPTPTPDLGQYQYSIGLLSDLHISEDSDDWWDEDDFRRCMDLFVNDQNIKCVMGSGDIAESATNDYQRHPEAVCDVDYAELKNIYDVPYWQVAGLRLFQPLGNHDYYGLFETRAGDTITNKKNSETIVGYNNNVNQRIANLWPTDGGINGIVPNRGRIVFELESGQTSAIGQYDMRFFSFNDYVDLYCRQGGYTGSSVWDSNKGGISDEAIRCAKNYVNSHWSEVKNSLIMWNNSGGHGRNGYSKLNYWLKKDNTIFIFLSVDYGNDIWGVNDQWHDRMIHARTIININEDDPYTKRLVEYVQGTGYGNADRLYDYQYYSPNTLIWVKEIVEHNPDCKIIIFTHHFLPNRTGNGVGLPKDGNWQYADIHPSNDIDSKEGGIYPLGSNVLTGIEFWFFTKLLNENKNIAMFSGHSHISWSASAAFDNHDYPILSPTTQNSYVYTKSSNSPIAESGWTISMPSMSKPRRIVNGQSVRRYQDAEMGVLDIYENGVKVKGYRVREDNNNVMELLVEKDIQLLL